MKMEVLVATVTALWAVTVGICTFEKPTIDSRTESIVATNAIFVRSGDFEKGHAALS